MFCRHCGRRIEDDSTFCRYCGKEVSEVPNNASIFKQTENTEAANPKEDDVEWKSPYLTGVPTSKEFFESLEKDKPKKSKSPGCLIMLFVILAAAVFTAVIGAPSKHPQPAEQKTTDYEQIGHEYGVEFVKLYLEDIGVYEYDRLGWYYPETYAIKDGIHYTSSKFDYYDTDHTYTIGIKYDSEDNPTVVFFSVDDWSRSIE